MIFNLESTDRQTDTLKRGNPGLILLPQQLTREIIISHGTSFKLSRKNANSSIGHCLDNKDKGEFYG